MRILVWHGWLLTGSGSNVYTANIARSWRARGHDVLVLCQERDAALLDFVDAAGAFAPGNGSFATEPTGVPGAPGRCTVVRPDIGGLLPVFVYDEYAGFDVKLFVDLSEAELDGYVERNVVALRAAIDLHEPDAIITGHEVMGPSIAARACAGTDRAYLAKLHGSGLEYAVKRQPRYRAHASEGLGRARVVVGGSRYMVRAAAEVAGGWEDHAVVVNPGCDTDLFRPSERDPTDRPTVAYVGKLIGAKGVHNFIASLGLTRRAGLRAVIVGYGGSEQTLRALAAALQRGDLAAARRIAAQGDGAPWDDLARFLDEPPDGFVERIRTIEIEFTGRLEHGPLAELLPGFDALVVPSVLPEAFGMVAAEAAACGVLAVVAGHSGIGEAGAALEGAIGAPGLLTFDPGDPIRSQAAAIERVLGLPPDRRAAMEQAAVELARSRWSWTHVAAELLRLALGPPP